VDGLGGAAAVGDALPLVLYWRLSGPIPTDARLVLELTDISGSPFVLGSFALDPSPAARLPLTVLIPPEAAGPAEVTLSLAGPAGERLAGPVLLGTLDLRVPARSFETPAAQQPLDLRLGEGVDLLGFDVEAAPLRAGESLALTLYWRAAARLTTPYTVFVHLLGPTGGIAAQVDQAPAQGARPTTGWLPPEVIADTHRLRLPEALPAGAYTLTAGLYDPRTGARLPVWDAAGRPLGDAVRLAVFMVN
jgi:hypothetical protein